MVIARLLLAVVFAMAGAAKLADLGGSRAALAGFGVPERAARPLGTLLPLAELAVAGLLLFSQTARAGAVGALSLLLLFAIGIALSMARGQTPECHCFGQLHSEPAGPKALVRNLVLAVIAGFVVFAGDSAGPGVSEAVAELNGAEWLVVAGALVFLILVATVAAAVVGLLRQNGRLLLRVEAVEAVLRAHGVDIPEPETAGPPAGLPVGEPAPDFSLPGLHGETVTLSSLRAGGTAVALVFTDPECMPCRQLLPQVGEWQRGRAGDLTMAVISRGASDELRVEASEHGLQTVLVDEEEGVSGAYRARLTPSAVLIDNEGRIATPVAAGNEAIAALVHEAAAPALEVVPGGTPPITEGDELPETAVRSLEGDDLTLADALGDRERAILFWDPGCGFCQRMLADLQSLESQRPEVTRSLLVVSQGTYEANRGQGIRSQIVIEREAFALADAVGAPGTPAALRVDGAGRIASSVALGADAVLGLVRETATRA